MGAGGARGAGRPGETRGACRPCRTSRSGGAGRTDGACGAGDHRWAAGHGKAELLSHAGMPAAAAAPFGAFGMTAALGHFRPFGTVAAAGRHKAAVLGAIDGFGFTVFVIGMFRHEKPPLLS